MSVREIRKNDIGGRFQFEIIVGDKTSRIVARFAASPYSQRSSRMVNFEVKNSRVIQLAQDILNAFHRQAKLKQFEPTLEEMAKKLKDQFGLEGYVINLIRFEAALKRKEDARRIYEWLKGNEDWLYDRGEFEKNEEKRV